MEGAGRDEAAWQADALHIHMRAPAPAAVRRLQRPLRAQGMVKSPAPNVSCGRAAQAGGVFRSLPADANGPLDLSFSSYLNRLTPGAETVVPNTKEGTVIKKLCRFFWNRPSFLLINFGLEALGVRQLSSLLKQHGCRVHSLFLQHSYDDRGSYTHAHVVVDFIRSQGYDIVGFSCMTGDYLEVRSITQLIRNMPERPLVIWGGNHPTVLPDECLEQGGADIVFNAAAEDALTRLLSGTPINEVPNIAWLDNGAVISNYSGVNLYPPDMLPFPDYDFSGYFFPGHFVMKDAVVVPLDTQMA